jgi:hypothetical protein
LKGLLDTSVFVALESGRPIGALPDEPAISVVTLAELHLGVLQAKDGAQRSQRLRTLARVESQLNPLPIDFEVARTYASLVFQAGLAGRRPPVMDAWVAATAVRHGLIVFTQDADFEAIPLVQVQRI